MHCAVLPPVFTRFFQDSCGAILIIWASNQPLDKKLSNGQFFGGNVFTLDLKQKWRPDGCKDECLIIVGEIKWQIYKKIRILRTR